MKASNMVFAQVIEYALRCTLVIGAVAAMVVSAFRPSLRKRSELFAGVLVMCFAMSLGSALFVSSRSIKPALKLDLYIYQFDQLFGQPSFLLGQFLAKHPALHSVTEISYFSIGWVVVVVLSVQLLRPTAELKAATLAFFLAFFLAPFFYVAFPVSGPHYAFGQYPSLPGTVAPQGIQLAAPPNGIPSVHFTLALLVVWYTRHWRIGWLFSGAFLILTILATLGLGEHYVFDLLVALPYTALILYLAPPRNPPAAIQS